MNDPHVADRLGEHLEGDLTHDEFARIDAHLAKCAACAAELRALRETVALLRGLPQPAQPADFAAGVMQCVEADRTPRARVSRLFRQATQPRVIASLAAGLAALLVLPMLDFGRADLLGSSSDSDRERVVAKTAPQGVPGAGAANQRRPRSLPPAPAIPVRSLMFRPGPIRIAADRGELGPIGAPRFGIYGTASPEIPLRDLDAELEAALANPAEFLERVRRTSVDARRPMIEPLVEHSARRGEVASFARTLGGGVSPAAVPVSTDR